MYPEKINDLSESLLKKRYLTQTFIAETNLAVAMGRVSTKDQKDEGRSDVAQIERIEEYAEDERLRIVKSWDVAETASKHEKRKHFIALINFIKKSHESGIPIKHVIFSHQSRSNRNRKSARELEDLIRDYEITLHCVRDNLRLNCKSPQEAWLMWDIFNNYNENFIKEHTKNVMDGTIKRVEMGLFPGKGPIGYRNVKKNNLNVFEVDPVIGPYVVNMFESYATGTYSISMLTDELSRLKERYPDIRTPTRAYVHQMLKNPFYIGEFYYSKTLFKGHPEYHPCLISYDLWKKVQDVISGKGTYKKRWSHEKFPFAGLMRCGGFILDSDGRPTDKSCNCAITAEVKRKMTKKNGYTHHHYYSCGNSRSVTGCSRRTTSYLHQMGLRRYLTQAQIEELLLPIFTPFEYSEAETKQIVNEYEQYEEALLGDHRKELLKLNGMKLEIQRLISESYEDKINGRISENLWREKYRSWMEEESRLKAEIKAFDKKEPPTLQIFKECIERAKSLKSQYVFGSDLQKRKLVEILASNIILGGVSVSFRWRNPWVLLPKKGAKEKWSGRLDSNQRPLTPHASALPDCATTRRLKVKSF